MTKDVNIVFSGINVPSPVLVNVQTDATFKVNVVLSGLVYVATQDTPFKLK